LEEELEVGGAVAVVVVVPADDPLPLPPLPLPLLTVDIIITKRMKTETVQTSRLKERLNLLVISTRSLVTVLL
jgi:hypothetical protein